MSFEKDLKMGIKGLMKNQDPLLNMEASSNNDKTTNAMQSSLSITIRAYGLGLNNDGASSLIPSSMAEFNDVMKYAFQSMQQTNVGMVSSIEIVAWTDNPQFQVAASLQDTVQKCDGMECTNVSLEVKKANLATNAEYIATMTQGMKRKIDHINDVHLCRSLLHGFTSAQQNEKLLNHREFAGLTDIPDFDAKDYSRSKKEKKKKITVGELKDALDGDAAHSAEDNAENYSKHFFEPCMDALSASFGGQGQGIAMVKPWYMVDECRVSTCTVKGASVDSEGFCQIDAHDETKELQEQYCPPTLKKSV